MDPGQLARKVYLPVGGDSHTFPFPSVCLSTCPPLPRKDSWTWEISSGTVRAPYPHDGVTTTDSFESKPRSLGTRVTVIDDSVLTPTEPLVTSGIRKVLWCRVRHGRDYRLIYTYHSPTILIYGLDRASTSANDVFLLLKLGPHPNPLSLILFSPFSK